MEILGEKSCYSKTFGFALVAWWIHYKCSQRLKICDLNDIIIMMITEL